MSVIAGYEISARVGRALGGLLELLHDTGTFGTVGAAVATAISRVGGRGDCGLPRLSKDRLPSSSSPIAPHRTLDLKTYLGDLKEALPS